MVNVFCKNTGTSKEFPEGTALQEIARGFDFDKPYPILAANVNNVVQGLRFKVYNNLDVEFFDYCSYTGRSVYGHSLSMMAYKACRDLYPGSRLLISRPISKGVFCKVVLSDGTIGSIAEFRAIEARMKELADSDIRFRFHEVRTPDAIELFSNDGRQDVVNLLKTRDKVYTKYYSLDDTIDFHCYVLVPSTGFLKVWSIEPYQDGFILLMPDRQDPTVVHEYTPEPKTFEIYNESKKWNEIMGLNYASDVNLACKRGETNDLIKIVEALQEKKIGRIADKIFERYQNGGARVVLLTGPSSSGKTTVCRKLGIQLRACGLKPVFFSTDDYFVDRIYTPRLPDGNYDYDNFETVDHKYLEKDVLRLLNGETVEVPEFNFSDGVKELKGNYLKLENNSILIIEGIHALNPKLIPSVPASQKFKIFINAITSLSLDDHNCIPTSDNRLLRRIIRDFNGRSYTPQETIRQWPNVRRAEGQWIIPFQEDADVLFNSTYLIEVAVLRDHAEIILRTVPKDCPEYSEANRLLKFLEYFDRVSDREIPTTSLLREFVGGSSFKY